MRALWYLHRRGVLVVAGMLTGLLLLVGALAVVLRGAQGWSHARHAAAATASAGATLSGVPPAPTAAAGTPLSPPTVAASDVAYWDALDAVTPSISLSFPAIGTSAAADPSAYARAFASELFTRDYRHATRAQLLSWVQYEDAPLRSPNYPSADWSKVLIDSLTDLTWDGANDTPVPAGGQWLALHAQQGWQTVTDVQVSTDATWEQQIAAGYQPPDPLATARDVSLTVAQHTTVAGRTVVTRYAVSLQLQLGSSPRHAGYAMAVSDNYVVQAVS